MLLGNDDRAASAKEFRVQVCTPYGRRSAPSVSQPWVKRAKAMVS